LIIFPLIESEKASPESKVGLFCFELIQKFVTEFFE